MRSFIFILRLPRWITRGELHEVNCATWIGTEEISWIIPDSITQHGNDPFRHPYLYLPEYFRIQTVAIVLNRKSQQLWTKTLAQTNPIHNQPTDYFGTDSSPGRTHCLYDSVHFQPDQVVDSSSKFLSFRHSWPMLSDRRRVSNTELCVLLSNLKRFATVALRYVECPIVLIVLLNRRLQLCSDWLDSSRMIEPLEIEMNYFRASIYEANQ